VPDGVATSPPREFGDDDFLYRRVLTVHVNDNVVTDAHCATEQWRRSLSADWSALRDNPAEVVKEDPGFFIRISVGDCRSIGLSVRYEPEPDNPSHCVLLLPEEKKSKPAIAKTRNEFLKKAVLFRTANGIVTEIGPATR
jgi:hypothetical protein